MCVEDLIREASNNVNSTIGVVAKDILALLPVKVLSSLIVRETKKVLRNGILSSKNEEFTSFGISLVAQRDANSNSISLVDLIKRRYEPPPKNLPTNSQHFYCSLSLPLPSSLYVHIDRWLQFLADKAQPIGRQVFLPMSMDCQHFFPNFIFPSGKVKYSLVGFLTHHGGCCDVFVKSSSSRFSDWLYFKDNM